MNLSKTVLLPLFGMIMMLAFLALSYTNYSLFIDYLLPPVLILTVVFFLRMREPKTRD